MARESKTDPAGICFAILFIICISCFYGIYAPTLARTWEPGTCIIQPPSSAYGKGGSDYYYYTLPVTFYSTSGQMNISSVACSVDQSSLSSVNYMFVSGSTIFPYQHDASLGIPIAG